MHGGGDHNIGRLATDEANTVYGTRQNKRSYGDLVPNPGPIPPFGHRDQVIATGGPITIDVIANDFDANNDVLDVQLLDTVSQQGGTIALSAGTGPGGAISLFTRRLPDSAAWTSSTTPCSTPPVAPIGARCMWTTRAPWWWIRR